MSKKQRSERYAVAFVSDLHTNSTVGLCGRRVELDDGGEYRPSPDQKWLWRNWLHFWAWAKTTADENKAKLLMVLNGDAGDGDHHGTSQIITRNPTTQLRLAAAVMAIPLQVVDAWMMVRGTGAHSGKASSFEEKLAEDCGAIPDAQGRYARWHLSLRVGGVHFDVAHHPESSSRTPWTTGTGATRVAEHVRQSYLSTGDQPPDVAIRSHVHHLEDSGKFTRRPYALILPPWQLTTEFGYRIGVAGSKLARVGGALFICEGGDYTVDMRTYRAPRKKPLRDIEVFQ